MNPESHQELLKILNLRFEQNMNRHPQISWADVEKKLVTKEGREKLAILSRMEETGGEPDVIGVDEKNGVYLFCDCSPESPAGRRSLCYDPEALASRKANKPRHSAIGMSVEMGIELLNEEQYHDLQQLGQFDSKTSSWLKTPEDIRKLGGAIFGDWRFGRVFVYHNGAESYYAARGFRGVLKI